MLKKESLIISKLAICILLYFSCDSAEPPAPTPKPVDKSSTIIWDLSSKMQLSQSGDSGYNGYARIIQLKNQSLLLVYESNGAVVTKKSTDSGNSWSNLQTVVSKGNNVVMATPDVLQLKNGTILIFYNPRPTNATDSSKKFSIRVISSDDNGVTWKNDKLLYEAGADFENGCWEPSGIQLPNGEVQVFFSNEGIYTNSSEQNISLLRSSDNGENWTTTPEIVSFSRGSRDGMPKPIYLSSINTIVISIEDNNNQNFKPYTIRNTIDENWQNVVNKMSSKRLSALAESLTSQVYAGAPYLAQLSTGETLLSYQSSEDRNIHDVEHSEMIVAIGDKNARNFKYKTKPFSMPATKYGLWNSITVLADDTIIALTTTNAYSTTNSAEVWMIKGSFKNE